MMNLNPQLRGMIDLNPQLREMMQNPEILRQLMNPETMQVYSIWKPKYCILVADLYIVSKIMGGFWICMYACILQA